MSRLQKSELNRLSSTQQKRSGEWLKSKPTGDASGLTYPDEWASDILIGRSGEFSIIFTSSVWHFLDTSLPRACALRLCLNKARRELFEGRVKFVQVSHLQALCDSRKTPAGGCSHRQQRREDWSINITYNHTQLPTSGVTCVKFKLFFFMLLWFCWEKMEIYIVEEKKKGIRIKCKVKTMR